MSKKDGILSVAAREREPTSPIVADMIEKMQWIQVRDTVSSPAGRDKVEGFERVWFTDFGDDPFATLDELQAWFNHKIDVNIRFGQISPTSPGFTFRASSLPIKVFHLET